MTRRGDGAPASQGVAYYGRINHRRAGVPWPVRARTTVGVILHGAPRQQEQQPAGFHGGLPAHLFQWRLSSCLRRRHAMPCRRSCCLAPSTPPQLAPSIASFRPWRRRVSAWLQARDGGQSSAPPRRAAEWQDGGPQGRTVFQIPSTPGSSRPSDWGWAAMIRRVATGVFLFRHDLLSWAGKAADHGASETALARMLDRECNRRDFGGGVPRDERRAAAHSFPAAAPYWPNQSTQSLSVTQCQIRGSELGPQRPWRFWSLRRRTTLFSFHGLLICSFTCAVCCGEARLTAHGIS